jgi:cell cycle sensor histidine kinase DivJ
LSEEIFDLEEATAQAIKFVKMQSDRKGVALKMVVAANAKTIFADRRAAKQILVNLLTNGVKFTPRGGEVSVTASRNAGGIDLVVTDTGVGISEKDLERLGQPFEQVDGAHVRKQEGTGLGLALVKALTAMHGGQAVMESTLGVGTTVRVYLPHAAVGSDVETAGRDVLSRKSLAHTGAG